MSSKKLLLIVDFYIQIWCKNLKNKFWDSLSDRVFSCGRQSLSVGAVHLLPGVADDFRLTGL
ncbi:MAG: hypothetical protein IKV83_00080, partial [Muribaculaceae bacterium]|nr:hypothetical protein [Muribaculaceae bacterium]